jgi:hypothetical protein
MRIPGSRIVTSILSSIALAASTVVVALSAQAPPPSPAQTSAAPGVAAATPAAPTAEQVKPFLGDWNIQAESPQGPLAMALNLKDTAGKIVGQISSDMMPTQPITDITKAGESLVLKYALDFNGTPVPVMLTLTPAGETVKVAFDFAGGQFTMNGTGTKKK